MSATALTTTTGNDDFYPTPAKLIEKMLEKVDWLRVVTVLEPSAGKGDIAAAAIKACEREQSHYNRWKLDLDCIEIDRNLQHILRGEGFRVAHDDFLTFKGWKKYDLIVMNPPFSSGDKHLLKALELQKDGGDIVCLLNAETLRNPYTNTRKLLARLLSEYGAEIEYIQNAFADAERSTDVEVALVRVGVPKREQESAFYETMKLAQEIEDEAYERAEVAITDFPYNLVRQHNMEVAATLALIREYRALKPYMPERINNDKYARQPDSMLCLTLGRYQSGHVTEDVQINPYLKAVRLKYWRTLFETDEFTRHLTSNLLEKYCATIEKLADYDFSLFNIQSVLADMNVNMIQGVKETILALFDKLSTDHSWYPECGGNVHYWDGWRSNDAHKVNYKVVIPTYGMHSQWNTKVAFESSKAFEVLGDIEKALNYLDGGLTQNVDLRPVLKEAAESGQSRKIRCKYFDVDIYKKGTTHIKFTNRALVDKLNIYAAQNRAWLPPDYGKRKYTDMDAEGQKAVDAFQGEKAYEEVVQNPGYYLFEPGKSVLMLGVEE